MTKQTTKTTTTSKKATPAQTKAAKSKPAKGTTKAKGSPAPVTQAATKPKAAPTKAAPKPAKQRAKRLSALDAAARVLADAPEPLNTKALIERMAAQGLWQSPGGKTPAATLYAALLREINDKGAEARFRKVDRGQFALAGKPAKKA